MKIKVLGLLWVMSLSSEVWGNDGDVFIEKTEEGIEMYFTVLSEEEKTCQVGQNKTWKDQAIDRKTTGKVTIPASANGYKVIKIGDSAFTNCANIDEVVIPEGVVSIGYEAFYPTWSLKSIVLPSSVESIGECAFLCDNVTQIVVAEGNRHYDSRENCNAIIETESNILIRGCVNTVIPKEIVEIAPIAFSNCHLTKITLPEGLKRIGRGAFTYCI